MSITRSGGRIVAIIAALAVTGGAGGQSSTSDERDDRIRALESEVTRLREEVTQLRQQPDERERWLAEQRAAEIEELVREVLADADTRVSSLDGGMTAGHDGRFFLASADGNFRLEISGEIQLRYYANFRDDSGGDDDFVSGYEARRIRLGFGGHVFDPTTAFRVQGEFGRGDGRLDLLDAFISKDFGNGLAIAVGQLKLPFMAEELMEETRLLAVEQSIVNEVFSLGRSQGIQVKYGGGMWRAYGAFSDGSREENSEVGTESADYALTGRFEMRTGDEWSRFRDFSSPIGATPMAMLVGGALDWRQGADTPGGSGDDVFTYTVDYQLEGSGWNGMVAVVGRRTETAGGVEYDDFGVTLQGGVMVGDSLEPFLQYATLIPDGDRPGDEELRAIVVGANYFIHGEALKVSGDIVWFLDDTASNDLLNSATGLGLLSSTNGDQVVARLQVQLLF